MNTVNDPTLVSLAELAKEYQGGAVQELLTEFTGANPRASVAFWLAGTYAPKGEHLLRLRVFLSYFGRPTPEYAELRGPVKVLAEAVALRVISVGDLCERLDYSNESSVLHVLVRGKGLMPSRVHRLTNLAEDLEQDVKAARSLWLDRISQMVKAGTKPVQAPRVTQPSPSPEVAEAPAVAVAPHPAPQEKAVPTTLKRTRKRRPRKPDSEHPLVSAVPAEIRVLVHELQAASILVAEAPTTLKETDSQDYILKQVGAKKLRALQDYLSQVLS